MSVFPGTHIPTGASSSSGMNTIIDDYMTPRMMSFRQICIYDERSTLGTDGVTWSNTFGNWLDSSETLRVRKNGQLLTYGSLTNVSDASGTFEAGSPDLDGSGRSRDVVEATYTFDYFPVSVLEAFIRAAVCLVNTAAVGSPTTYTVDTMPSNWCGVVSDSAFAMAMEKLLLDYDLWKYRLVFAVGPNDVYEGGGGDVVAQLELLKRNAEERARLTLENEAFKRGGNFTAPPTSAYFSAINGTGSGQSGVPFLSGRLRGWHPNKYL